MLRGNSKDFKDKNKKANCWEKIGEKFKLSVVEAEAEVEAEVIFFNIRTVFGRYLKRLETLLSGVGRDAVPREFQNLEWLNPHIAHRPSSTNLRSKFPPQCLPHCFDAVLLPAQSACNFGTSPDRTVGKSGLCNCSRSSVILWKQLPLRSSAICDLRSAICDPRPSAIIWKPALKVICKIDLLAQGLC